MNRHFADFFVEETRKNPHKFSSYEEEVSMYIENTKPIVTLYNIGTVYAF